MHTQKYYFDNVYNVCICVYMYMYIHVTHLFYEYSLNVCVCRLLTSLSHILKHLPQNQTRSHIMVTWRVTGPLDP